MGLCLPADCRPYARFAMGSTRCETDHLNNVSKDVRWEEPVKVIAKASDRKASVEVWNDISVTSSFKTDMLLVAAVIYDVVVDQPIWYHCYGGAFGATREDVALQMLKGTVQPASTYHGTVVVHFGTRQKMPRTYFGSLRTKRKP